jgi:hypothetical protein
MILATYLLMAMRLLSLELATGSSGSGVAIDKHAAEV